MAARLPFQVARPIEAALARLLQPDGANLADFLTPDGEAAILAPDSVSWMVFKNPLSLFVGGVAAVVLELAEPAVRTGVWQNTSFRERPLARLQRTGYAAMMTVYGPRSRAEAMIEAVVQLHGKVRGTIDGRTFSAMDPDLLTWVHATASFGFLEAYNSYVRPVSDADRDRYYAEGRTAARMYGAVWAPDSQSSLGTLFDDTRPRLEASPIIIEFLSIMQRIDVLPKALRFLQSLLVAAAVDALPPKLRRQIGLGERCSIGVWQRRLICRVGAAADRLILKSNPAVLSCRRLGLPDGHLYGS